MFILILSILLITLLTYITFKVKSSKNLPPGPWQNFIPFLGFLPFLNPEKPQETLFELSKKYGKVFGLQLGSIYAVVLSDVGIIREALRRDEFSGRAPLNVTFGIFNGFGLITAEGDLWKDQRGLVVKWLRDMGMIKFGFKRDVMQNRILDGIHQCVQEIHKNTSKVLNPAEIITDTFGNIVIDFIFGFKYDWSSEEWKYLKHLQEEGVKLVGVNAGANFLPILRFLPSNRKNMQFILDGMKNQHKIYKNLIEKCQNNLEDYPDCIMKRFLLEKSDREAKNHELAGFCSETQLVHLLADISGASLDTTLCTLRWFMLIIAINQECQDKIFEELKSHGILDKIELEDVKDLNYLKAAVAEVQRLKTVVPCGLPHGNPGNDATIGGFFIPKNTMIMPLQYALHMDENSWPQPHVYNPMRFLDDDGKFFTPPNFIPFQVGKRMCPGDELARMFLNLFTGNLILNFKFKLSDDEKTLDLSGIPGLTLCPPEYHLIFEKRD